MTRLNALSAALAAAGILTMTPVVFAQPVPQAQAARGEIQEVTVTAQKRPQASSKVALALSVIDSEDLKSKGVTSAANLTELVPNVQIGSGYQGGMEITIRGIGNGDNSERGDPQAAFHIDGIYIGRPQGAAATFFDLERVEVLRGPQGTLYGRNANAGAVNLITRKPGSKFEGLVAAEVGNYNARKLDAMVNVPVNDTFSLRAVLSSQKHDGYSDTANASTGFTKDRDDQNNLSGRVQGLLKFSKTASLLVGVDASRDKGAWQHLFNITSGVLPSKRVDRPQNQGAMNNESNGLTSEFKLDLGAVDLTYLFGHRTAKRDENSSYGTGPSVSIDFSNRYKQDSHELRLSSNSSGQLQWVAGLYAFKEVGRNIDLDVFLPSGARLVHFVQDPAVSQSKAVFGQATYALTPALRATLGLRSTQDQKSREGQTRTGAADTPVGVVGNSAAGKWDKLTYRVGGEFDLSPSQMLYATLSTGYKAGGFNDGNAVAGDPNFNPSLYYDPEDIKALEAGIKGRFLDNKVQLGASVFVYDYSNLQKSAVSNASLVTLNAAKATVKGLEVEGRAAMGANGRLNFALGLLDASYDKYVSPNGTNLSGQKLDRAPKATLTLGYTHHWDFESGARVSGYLGTRYSTASILSYFGTAAAAPKTFVQPSNTKTDITLTYAPASDRWSLQAYAKNLENKSTLTGIFTLAGANYAALSEPRTIGLRGSFKF